MTPTRSPQKSHPTHHPRRPPGISHPKKGRHLDSQTHDPHPSYCGWRRQGWGQSGTTKLCALVEAVFYSTHASPSVLWSSSAPARQTSRMALRPIPVRSAGRFCLVGTHLWMGSFRHCAHTGAPGPASARSPSTKGKGKARATNKAKVDGLGGTPGYFDPSYNSMSKEREKGGVRTGTRS